MTKSPSRLGLKFSLKQTPQRQPDDIVPIFQRWIQEHTVDGMLIDVIDYKHVPEGPGVLLIADEGDYAYDLGDGEIGLNYIRKRAIPDDLAAALRLTFHHALKAAIALEADAPGDIVFDYASAKISFLDRMQYRNDPAVFDALRAELAEILSAIYRAPAVISRAYEDPRRLFAVQCHVPATDVDAHALEKRLAESWQSV